jgi:uroporphyrinogen-III synthase
MAIQSHSPTILLTRPLAQSRRFAGVLAGITDLPVVISPLTETRFLDATPPPGGFSAIILTSESGARAAGRMRAALPLRAWCVGDHTAKVASDQGFAARSAKGDAAALIALIAQEGERGPLLHLRGADTRGEIAKTLTNRGIVTQELTVYAQAEQPLTAEAQAVLQGGAAVIVPLFSPLSARRFARQAGPRPGLWIAALSPAVAQELAGLAPVGLEIADQPDGAGMVLAVERLLAAACGP